MNRRFYRGAFPWQGLAAIAAVVAVLPLVVAGRPSAAEEPATADDAGKVAGEPQPAMASEQMMDLSGMPCVRCHACEAPTKEKPCLRMCPRSVAEVIAEAVHEKLPDDVILLNAFAWPERRFLPVPFNHKRHADMAGMAEGCQVCHHHTARGQLHPACKTCHKAALAGRTGEELRKPSLKGAYHRQCMGCHRNWANTTRCGVCHLPKGDESQLVVLEEMLSRGDVAGAHPPVESPEHVLHQTSHEPGPNVMFRHKEHIDLYGFRCERCHRGAGCARCHGQAQKAREQLEVVKRETHGACFDCHAEDACERCHSKEENPLPQRFDHSSTGFVLGKYHGELTCRACHKRLLFLRKLESECGTCHTGWDAETFDHAMTGQVLDENHAEFDCEECHLDSRFDRPPACDECHDEDEGISFPERRPGPVSGAAAPASS